MRIQNIVGIIDRRILVNFTVEPAIIRKIIPPPFSLKIYEGKAIAGVCLIRLKQIRPKGFPAMLSISSENGAHRIAVEWIENGVRKEGVYIPRRDSSSVFNNLAGGRIFPGKHFHTEFNVDETKNTYRVSFNASDNTSVLIDAGKSDAFNQNSIFKTLDSASAFFEKGSIGYSPHGGKFEGIELKTYNWKVQPLKVNIAQSTFFENKDIFPAGSVQFDNALLMTEVDHEWNYIGQIS